MRAPMYRQRPSLLALIGAAVVLILGTFATLETHNRTAAGELGPHVIIAVVAGTLILVGALFIVAFARYQFTHLWKSTGARHSDKYKNSGRRQPRVFRS